MTEKFKCYRCKKVFEGSWSNEEAEKELKENFGPDQSKADCVVVCDDCYKAMMGWAKENNISLREDRTK